MRGGGVLSCLFYTILWNGEQHIIILRDTQRTLQSYRPFLNSSGDIASPPHSITFISFFFSFFQYFWQIWWWLARPPVNPEYSFKLKIFLPSLHTKKKFHFSRGISNLAHLYVYWAMGIVIHVMIKRSGIHVEQRQKNWKERNKWRACCRKCVRLRDWVRSFRFDR